MNNCPMCRGLGHLEPFIFYGVKAQSYCTLCNGSGEYKEQTTLVQQENDKVSSIKLSSWNSLRMNVIEPPDLV